MHRINDKSAAVMQIQRYLMDVDKGNRHIAPTGIYDEQTRAAVRDFQKQNSLAQSGTVDLETHTALKRESEIYGAKKEVRAELENPDVFPLSLGFYGREMERIHELLITLLEYYGIHHNLKRGKYFSAETEKALKSIKTVLTLSEEAIIDELTYLRILREVKSINIFKQLWHR